MQHNARDPNRDHDHGRIYRVTYPSRALVKPAVIAEAPVATLLENLKSPEYRTRYRTHRELRGRPADEVLAATRAWVASLDADDPNYERHLLEGLWVTWGQNRLDLGLLERALTGKSHHLRAAAARVLRHEFRKVPNHLDLLLRAAGDEHGRVRLEAIVAASWIGGEPGARILVEALNKPLDRWMENAAIYTMIPLKPTVQALVSSGSLNVANNATARDYLERDLKFGMFDVAVSGAVPKNVVNRLGDDGAKIWAAGREIYSRDGHCTTCHQSEGQGVAGIYPPLARTEWVNGPADRVIKIVLHGLMGEITVNNVTYAANLTPPMPGFGGMLNDAEIAAVVTYVRNSFGNNSRPVTAEDVSRVRAATTDQVGFYQAKDLATPAGEAQGGRN
jgi:mono/diheme cytochrome c family protein